MPEDAPAAARSGRKPAPPLTIYDVARTAGVSIASVSRVLNGHTTPRPETRERVLRAVQELGFVPDGAARALSSRLKEIVAVVFRRPRFEPPSDPELELEDAGDSLLFMDVLNRGIEVSAQRRGFDLLLSSIDVNEHNQGAKITKLAGKSDGIILHDRVLTPSGVIRLADRVPVVTLAGTPTRASVNLSGDNAAGMRELVHHLLGEHGYRSIAYISGHTDSPDNLTRAAVVREVAEQYGVPVADTEDLLWKGEYTAAGGARVMSRLLDGGGALPRAICCANDQSALGVVHELQRRGLKVPDDVAVTGFDDVSIARHVSPALTTVRQPIERLGALAFETLHSLIAGERPAERQILLPVHVVYRASCGCRPDREVSR